MHLTNDHLSILYERHSRELFRYLKREVGDSHVALELVGETFAQAVSSRRKFKGNSLSEARPWLFGIARNLTLRYQLKSQVERRAMDRLGLERPELEPDAELELPPEAVSELVRKYLSGLKVEYREAVTLRYLEGQSYAQIAASLGTSEDVARARVSRGIKKMRQLAYETLRSQEQG